MYTTLAHGQSFEYHCEYNYDRRSMVLKEWRCEPSSVLLVRFLYILYPINVDVIHEILS
jgi:hypothetical protein